MQLLIIEDNPSTLKMLAFLLRNEGYEVHAVPNAGTGLELLRNEPIDLVVLDVMLPDSSGLQVCRQLRNEGITVPILVISALGRRDDKLAALAEGADDYMTKPFDPSEVVARVQGRSLNSLIIEALRAEVLYVLVQTFEIVAARALLHFPLSFQTYLVQTAADWKYQHRVL